MGLREGLEYLGLSTIATSESITFCSNTIGDSAFIEFWYIDPKTCEKLKLIKREYIGTKEELESFLSKY